MAATVIQHPVAQARLTTLRDRTTPNSAFRTALHDLSRFVLYETLRDWPVADLPIDTPLQPTTGSVVAELPLIVPIMRAGLGMLDAALELLPDAAVGFIGLRRDEATFASDAYVNTVPDDLDGQRVIILDPMLATGGSLLHAVQMVVDANAGDISVASVLAAPEGIAHVEAAGHRLHIFTAAIDDRLNDDAYIVPGLGDAGDRQFGAP